MNLPPQIAALTRLLRRDLAAIRERLDGIERVFNDHTEFIERERSRDEQRRHEPVQVVAIVKQPEAVEREQSTRQKRAQTTQEIIAAAGWCAFVAALAYAFLVNSQLVEMRMQTAQLYRQAEVENAGASHRAAETYRQLGIAQEQADAARIQATAANSIAQAAQRQADIAVRNLESQERPWVGYDHINMHAKVTVGSTASNSLSYKNWGKGPAIHVLFQYRMKPFCSSFPAHPPYEVREGTPIALMPGQQAETADIFFSKALTDEMFAQLKGAECELYIYARITYRDAAGHQHWRHICAIWDKTTDSSFQSCMVYNDGDEDYEDGREP